MANIIETRVDDLNGEFEFLDDWEDRYRYIIDIGKNLEPLLPEELNEENKIRGCASKVWLVMSKDDATGNLMFRGESDSSLVQGLVGILLQIYSNAKGGDIIAYPPENALEKLKLFDALTPNRANGLRSMSAKIVEFATQNA